MASDFGSGTGHIDTTNADNITSGLLGDDRYHGFRVGDMKMTATNTTPTDWLVCDGAAVSRTTYAELFAALSTFYGAGDGSTTFNVPDLRDRIPVGAGTSITRGASDGLALASRGARFDMSHSHTGSSSSDSAGTPAGSISSVSAGTPAGTNSTDPGHTHTLSIVANDLNVTTQTNTTATGAATRVSNLTGATVGNHSHSGSSANSGGSHTHTFTGSALAGHSHTFTGSALGTHTHTITVASNTIPRIPYLGVRFVIRAL